MSDQQVDFGLAAFDFVRSIQRFHARWGVKYDRMDYRLAMLQEEVREHEQAVEWGSQGWIQEWSNAVEELARRGKYVALGTLELLRARFKGGYAKCKELQTVTDKNNAKTPRNARAQWPRSSETGKIQRKDK